MIDLYTFFKFGACFWLLIFLTACSGLDSEPEIVATIPIGRDVGLSSPDLAQGAQIYAMHCTACHGETGRGNGQLVLDGQVVNPPPDFTDPVTIQGQSPNQWFATISNGRLDKLMPPWRERLSEEERWAVAFYTYTMSYQPDQIMQGESLWRANCTECHGTTGAGDGPRSSELDVAMSNLTRPEAQADLSDGGILDIITIGKGDAMPAFGSTLNEAARRAVVAYTRTLSLTNVDSIAQPIPSSVSTAEADTELAAEILGTVRGRISNGTEGEASVSGVVATLHILDSQFNGESLETTVGEDGTFIFNDVSIRNDRVYVATALYRDRTFGSNLVTGDTSIPTLDLPITIFEPTDDTSVITITNFVIQVISAPGSLQVSQIVNFKNTSDRVFSQDKAVGNNRYASIIVPLPPGAQLLDTAGDAQRYVLSEDSSALLDTRPVLPGEDHIAHVIYTLPYENSANIRIPLEYMLEGSAQLLVQPDTLMVSSEQLEARDPQTVNGVRIQDYGATLSLAAGSTLSFAITSSPELSNDANQTPAPNLLAYALIALGSLSLLAAAVIYYYGRRIPSSITRNRLLNEIIIEQIAELDDLHIQGKIDPIAYQEQRARLKARLVKLMSDK